jgi:ferredoxin
MRLIIDPDRCKGHGQCVLAAPNVVELGDDGKSRVIHELIGPGYADEARTAELLCPEEAVTIIE